MCISYFGFYVHYEIKMVPTQFHLCDEHPYWELWWANRRFCVFNKGSQLHSQLTANRQPTYRLLITHNHLRAKYIPASTLWSYFWRSKTHWLRMLTLIHAFFFLWTKLAEVCIHSIHHVHRPLISLALSPLHFEGKQYSWPSILKSMS